MGDSIQTWDLFIQIILLHICKLFAKVPNRTLLQMQLPWIAKPVELKLREDLLWH
jgi:hypothetical protein